MTKEFIPYEQALELKELGFDDKTLKSYDTSVVILNGKYLLDDWYDVSSVNTVKAPLYQQAFRWFREMYGLNSISPTRIYKTDLYQSRIIDWNTWEEIDVIQCSSYEESELECLKKLIEIVKNK